MGGERWTKLHAHSNSPPSRGRESEVERDAILSEVDQRHSRYFLIIPTAPKMVRRDRHWDRCPMFPANR